MTTSRNRLHQNKLQAFTEFCQARGWQQRPAVGEFEVLRMRHPDEKHPLLVYKRLSAKEHLTAHGNANKMLDEFLNHRPALSDDMLKPVGEEAADSLPWV